MLTDFVLFYRLKVINYRILCIKRPGKYLNEKTTKLLLNEEY